MEKCLICYEAITNPICPECLEKQMMYWAHELQPSLASVLKRVGESVKEFDMKSTDCVICRRNMNICPHCYCKEIYSWLLENGYLDLAQRFLSHFNFELDYRFDLKAQVI